MSTADKEAIRPFRVAFSDEALADMKRRDRRDALAVEELVADQSQGVQLATMQQLARAWATDYDWRKTEAKLNALPNFVTEIDGVDIHFIHVRSKQPNALPIIITHGWPGSIIEQMKIIEPLTNPTAHGGSAADAFDVVIPSLPGHGFSGAHRDGLGPGSHRACLDRADEAPGIHAVRRAGGRLGECRDRADGVAGPPGSLGIHTNMPAAVPPTSRRRCLTGGPPPSDLSPDERHAWEQLDAFYKHGLGYAGRCRTARRLSTRSPIRRSEWLPGCSITTRAATR